MKKFVSLVLVLILCMSTAFATSAPSVTLGDLTVFTIIEHTMKTSAAPYILPLLENMLEKYPGHAELFEDWKEELEKLQAAATVEDYFGEVRDLEDEIVILHELFENEQRPEVKPEDLVVHEFYPVIAGGWVNTPDNEETTDVDEEGYVDLDMQFPTVYNYEKNEPVTVMIGEIVKEIVDDVEVQTVVWTPVEASVTEDGHVATTLPNELVMQIQEKDCLLAILSLDAALLK